MGHGIGGPGLGGIIIKINPVDPVRLVKVTIITDFIEYPETDKDTCGNTHAKSQYIYQGICSVPQCIPEGDAQIVDNHMVNLQ
jgi:hypothetical protein